MKLNFATITPTRGDRPDLLKFCKRQLAAQILQPSKSYFIEYPADSINKFDLVGRIRKGIELAKADGIDWVVIMEDDDNYGHQYLSNMMEGVLKDPKISFIGSSKSLYYNLKNNTWNLYDHPNRASLFQTAFKISALKENSVLHGFKWPDDDEAMLDIELWKYAVANEMCLLYDQIYAIGMKHGIGLCGGKGHKIKLANEDPEREFLKTLVSEEAFAFYMDLKV